MKIQTDQIYQIILRDVHRDIARSPDHSYL